MSRAWCPAIAADVDASFDKEHLGASEKSPRSDVKPRLISAQAANVAAVSEARIGQALDKMAASPPSKFSAKVATSTDACNREVHAQEVTVGLPAPVCTHTATVPDEVAPLEPLPRGVAFRSLSHLDDAKHLALEGIDLSRIDATSEELAAALHQAPLSASNTKLLSIRSSIRGTLGVAQVLQAAGTALPHLRSLDLSANPVSFAIGEELNAPAAEATTKYLATAHALHYLNLSSTSLGPASSVVLPALRSHNSITTLDLSRNGLGLQQEESAVTALVQLVQENKFLISLDLANNEIGAAVGKQVLEGLKSSNTRVKTPEPEPEPEAEEYTDEVPPEEEAPQVTVGFPQEEAAPVSGGGGADGGEPIPADTTAVSEPPPDVDTTGELGNGDDVEANNTATEGTPGLGESTNNPAEGEEDAEAAEAARLEAEQRAKEELERREEEWRARMRQYIWEPEQVIFVHSEGVARRAVVSEYVRTTIELKKEEKVHRKEAKGRQLQRERTERDRRSGWPHLQELDLSGNPLGNACIKILSQSLRCKIPLSAEEHQNKEEESQKLLEEMRSKAKAERLEQRRIQREATLAEARARDAEAAKAAAATSPAPADRETEAGSPAPAAEGDDTEAMDVNAEEAVVEDEPMPPPPEEEPTTATSNGAEDGTAEGADEDGAGPGAGEEDIDVSDITVPPVIGTKPGWCTLKSLKLDQCRIGTAGLVHLSRAISGECPTLEILSMRKNKFGTKKESKTVESPTKGDDGDKTDAEGDAEPQTIKVEVPEWVSPGIVALSKALGEPGCNLRVLDLSWNGLYPNSIRTLATGIRNNRTLTYLGLEGSRIGLQDNECGNGLSAFAVLLEAVATQGKIGTLLLGSCGLESCFTETEATLLSTLPVLTSLNLNNNQFTNEQFDMWARVLQDMTEEALRAPLEHLTLENNWAVQGSAGGASISKVILKFPSLSTLSLRDCQHLGDEGALRILPAMGSMLHKLAKISFHRCGLHKCYDTMATAFCQLPALRVVDIGDNEAAVDEQIGFIETLGDAKALQALTLWSRSGESDDLIPSLLSLAERVPSLIFCDVGIPMSFKKRAATEESFADIFEELEKKCLANRLRANK